MDKSRERSETEGMLNSYVLTYRVIKSRSLKNFDHKKLSIQSKNQQEAIAVLVRELDLVCDSKIRIVKVEQTNTPSEPKKKRTKSKFTWLAGSAFLIAGTANLLINLF